MERSDLTDELERAEGLMLQGQSEQAAELLARLAEDAEEYVDKNCPTTSEVQWFSFPTLFERLAYRRVEKDPRELRDVGEPLDRLYNDLALANVHAGDYDEAMEALKRAVRWNPMDCSYRLNLADLFRVAGDVQEYLALTYSVFERASDARHLARAFVNFSGWFAASEKPRAAAAALRAAHALDVRDTALEAALDQAAGTERDPGPAHGCRDARAARCRGAAGRGQCGDCRVPAHVRGRRHGCRAARRGGHAHAPGARPRGGARGPGPSRAHPRGRCGGGARWQRVGSCARLPRQPSRAAPGKRTIAKNRSARHEYFIDETFEAGIELTGTEVKSLRERACQITDAFCLVRSREVWLHGVHIHPYSNGGVWNVDPDRKRRLLLHRRQIDYPRQQAAAEGHGTRAAGALLRRAQSREARHCLARGKKLYDKRADMARRDSDREIARALKEMNR